MVDDEDSPLFPDRLGREIKAEAVLEFIEAIAEFMGGHFTLLVASVVLVNTALKPQAPSSSP